MKNCARDMKHVELLQGTNAEVRKHHLVWYFVICCNGIHFKCSLSVQILLEALCNSLCQRHFLQRGKGGSKNNEHCRDKNKIWDEQQLCNNLRDTDSSFTGMQRLYIDKIGEKSSERRQCHRLAFYPVIVIMCACSLHHWLAHYPVSATKATFHVDNQSTNWPE